MRTFAIAIGIALSAAFPALAQQSAEDARAEAAEAMGGTPLPDIENYPDFATGAAWNWMKVMESGDGPLDAQRIAWTYDEAAGRQAILDRIAFINYRLNQADEDEG